MQKQIAKELKTEAQRVAERFSNPKREGNPTAETFEIQEIIPLQMMPLLFTSKKQLRRLEWLSFITSKEELQKDGNISFLRIATFKE